MAKIKQIFECQICQHQLAKWAGQCPACKNWNTFEEKQTMEFKQAKKITHRDGNKSPQKINQIKGIDQYRFQSGLSEFDRVMGGGITLGSLTLIGGEPGIGKSTLLLEVCKNILTKNNDYKILYVSGEESEFQVAGRAKRIGLTSENIFVVNETCWEKMKDYLEEIKPDIMVLDSIQTTTSIDVQANSGSSTQIKEITYDLMNICKSKGLTCFIVGHVTKEGNIAGPKMLEHMVDTVVYFEGDQIGLYRILRSVKNRFGNTQEVGIFEMNQDGLNQVENPSSYFIDEKDDLSYGRSLSCLMEGTRTLFVEIQALVNENKYGNGRRTGQGVDSNRLSLLIAVIEKYFQIPLSFQDVYLNVVGGLKLNSRESDLSIIASVMSSYYMKPIPLDTIFIGEVGLTGEVRPVPFIEKRVHDAKQLSYKKIIVSARDLGKVDKIKDVQIIGIKKAEELKRLFM
jgi:DNA repair protein RadA/Sms